MVIFSLPRARKRQASPAGHRQREVRTMGLGARSHCVRIGPMVFGRAGPCCIGCSSSISQQRRRAADQLALRLIIATSAKRPGRRSSFKSKKSDSILPRDRLLPFRANVGRLVVSEPAISDTKISEPHGVFYSRTHVSLHSRQRHDESERSLSARL
jgi:hypothetical protein